MAVSRTLDTLVQCIDPGAAGSAFTVCIEYTETIISSQPKQYILRSLSGKVLNHQYILHIDPYIHLYEGTIRFEAHTMVSWTTMYIVLVMQTQRTIATIFISRVG